MIKILFICHGNICRSPMAEFVMKDMVKRQGISDRFLIASAATSSEEIGNPIYPPAKRMLRAHGIGTSENELGVHAKRARRLTDADYAEYDLLIGMDSANRRNLLRKYGDDPEGKIFCMLDFTKRPEDVADPWYTGDFEATWADVKEGCEGLLEWMETVTGNQSSI